jgi:hypothetical protein
MHRASSARSTLSSAPWMRARSMSWAPHRMNSVSGTTPCNVLSKGIDPPDPMNRDSRPNASSCARRAAASAGPSVLARNGCPTSSGSTRRAERRRTYRQRRPGHRGARFSPPGQMDRSATLVTAAPVARHSARRARPSANPADPVARRTPPGNRRGGRGAEPNRRHSVGTGRPSRWPLAGPVHRETRGRRPMG